MAFINLDTAPIQIIAEWSFSMKLAQTELSLLNRGSYKHILLAFENTLADQGRGALLVVAFFCCLLPN